ncbi:sugar ABC transporter substrate-binding protein [Lentzea sp. NPDC005914]|uniref:sugar ABC transporter substrate-binding protein n=1 Tax=Lentzea sp. NPDC005914 TaxID=3154572 RepID=UPI003408177A
MKGWRGLAAGAAALAVAVSGCGTSTNSGSGTETKEITVWLMDGSAPTTLTDALNKEFESANGIKVKYEVQKWGGIQEKLTTALASSTPPDVIELGNTQTASFADQGTLMDLTADAKQFNESEYLGGLKDSLTLNGKQYGVPFYAANRTVIYRTDLFQAAGIAQPPTSRAEWIDAINKLKAANASNPDFQALYLPGQSWYFLLSLIWDEGGDVATQDGGKWTSKLDSAQSKAGFEAYKALYDASAAKKAPADTDEAKPQQMEVFGTGNVGMMIGLPWELAGAVKAKPDLEGKTSAFAIPSKKAGTSAPVFLGGSNLAIPAASKNGAAAKKYLALLSSKKYQEQLAAGGSVPGTSKDTAKLATTPLGKAMATSSQNGKVTPVTPKWAAVEAGQNPLKDALTAYLSGAKTLDQATKDASDAVTKAMG